MPQHPQKAFIVSHTHWDREWYLRLHEFRVNLVKVVREVLDRLENDPAFKHFVLDGQAIILEDYLQIQPGDRERLAQLVRNGALSIGPWYILPDEFLIGGEAHVRNLLYGHKVASAFGPVQKIGYTPDAFGHIAQMPQILRAAGIDAFIYTRGNGAEIDALGFEYTWSAPDGSEVLAIYQCEGYCNAGGLGFAELWHAHTQRNVDPSRAVEQVRELFAKIRTGSQTDIYLLNNGCDHFPPQRDFQRILEALQAAFPQTQFVHAGFEEFVEALKTSGVETKKFSGELASGRRHHLLSGVWSTRMYLKQRNEACQTLLAGYLEPLSAYSHFVLGRDYPQGEIDYAWKLLLQNQPHDSICGCSTDEVHREMLPRFDGVMQTAEQLLRGQLQQIAPTFARSAPDDRSTLLCVANPSPEKRSEVIEWLVVLQPFGFDVDDLELLDESGRPVTFEMVDVKYVERFWGIDYRMQLFADRQHELFQVYLERFRDRLLRDETQKDESDCFATIQFLAEDVPAVGHANFRLVETTTQAGSPAEHSKDASSEQEADIGFSSTIFASGNRIENEYYEIRMHPNGTLDVLDKKTGAQFAGLNQLQDTEDVGDEYDYAPCRQSETVSGDDDVEGHVSVLQRTGFRALLEAHHSLVLPQGIESDRLRRSSQRKTCHVRTRVRLDHGSRLIVVDVWFDNVVDDHRLRVVFPTSIATKTLVSDGHFYLNHRPARQPTGEDWVQPPAGTYPQQEFSLVEDGRRGLAILNRGLPEIAIDLDSADKATLALTLLRCVGWLSRDDFETRRCSNAGPTLHTPEAQCPGLQHFQYALVTFAGDHIEADIKGLSQRYRTPMPVVQGVADQNIPGGRGLVTGSSKRTCISAIKKHESRDTLILRLYNLTDETVGETLDFGCDIRRAWRSNLLEERQFEVQPEATRQLRLELRAHEIVNLEIELEI